MANVPTTSQPSEPQFTPLALKYTHPTINHRLARPLRGIEPFKSGLTPLTLAPDATAAERGLHSKLEHTQRTNFHGWTAAELHGMEAFAPTSTETLPPQDEAWLNNLPVHPIFDRSNWDRSPRGEHLAKIPLHDGTDELWEASNPRVWNELEPCLKLASLFLTNAHMWPWWDALLDETNYEPIPADQIPETPVGEERRSGPYQRFRLRPPHLYRDPGVKRKVQNQLLSFAGMIDFQIHSGILDSESHMPPIEAEDAFDKHFFSGEAFESVPSIGHMITVCLAFEHMVPLLKRHYNEAERAADRCRLVNTIVHETAHAIWAALNLQRGVHPIPPEPYFEDEPLSELGWSIENALFGDTPYSFVGDRVPQHSLSSGGMFDATYPQIFSARSANAGMPVLIKKPTGWFKLTKWPIPIAWFMDIHKSAFWEAYVKIYAYRSTFRGPKIEGSLDRQNPATGEIDIKNHLFEVGIALPVQIRIDQAKMSALEIRASMMENERRARTDRIREAIIQRRNNGTVILDAEPPDNAEFLPGEKPPPAPYSTQRYVEIREYLFKHRRELALDTMDTKCYFPEHVMYAHIQRLGGLVLGVDEWRDFLRICASIQELFNYYDDGYGIIERTPIGWPKTALAPSLDPEPPEPDNKTWTLFLNMARKLQNGGIPEIVWENTDFWDYYPDVDCLFYTFCFNMALEDAQEHIKSVQWKTPFTKAEMDTLIYWSEKKNGWFTFGPKGTYRIQKRKFPKRKVSKVKRKLKNMHQAVNEKCRQQ